MTMDSFDAVVNLLGLTADDAAHLHPRPIACADCETVHDPNDLHAVRELSGLHRLVCASCQRAVSVSEAENFEVRR